jgi:hypothetical protein
MSDEYLLTRSIEGEIENHRGQTLSLPCGPLFASVSRHKVPRASPRVVIQILR